MFRSEARQAFGFDTGEMVIHSDAGWTQFGGSVQENGPGVARQAGREYCLLAAETGPRGLEELVGTLGYFHGGFTPVGPPECEVVHSVFAAVVVESDGSS